MNDPVVQLRERLLELSTDRRVIAAIDGRCAAGKTTLAAALRRATDCAVFHMDDFFLRPEQRKPERLRTPGGNVDHERFLREVLLPLRQGESVICFRPFDCRTQTLCEPVRCPAGNLIVVEGSYSCHPALWDDADVHIFMTVSAAVQRERILQRNGSAQWEVFAARWIPMEENYFSAFQIEQRCDLSIDAQLLIKNDAAG